MRNRILNIKGKVNMTELLSKLDLLPYSGAEEEFQMRCPFHGQDSKPSARVYRNELFKCFACGVAYDVIGFYSEYKSVGTKDACYLLEKEFGISWDYSREEPESNPKVKTVQNPSSRQINLSDLVRITEKQIIERKRDMELQKYAKALYVLDRAEESNDLSMINSLREKIGLADVTKRHI